MFGFIQQTSFIQQEENNPTSTMATKKYLKLKGSKLTAEVEDEKPTMTEEVKTERPSIDGGEDPGKLAGEMGNLSINTVEKAVGKPKHQSDGTLTLEENTTNPAGASLRTNWADDDDFTGDDDNVFLEQDPTAPIFDGGSPDSDKDFSLVGGASPPRNTPLLAANAILQTFEGAVRTAQQEVSKEASEAIKVISNNLRAVERKSLVCLEREMAVARREHQLRAMEDARRARSRSQKRPRGQNQGFSEDEATRYGTRLSRSKKPRYGLDTDVVGRITNYNKKGKPYFTYVDDAAAPYALKSRPDYKVVPNVPWLHKGGYRLQARAAEQFWAREKAMRDEEEMPDLIDEDWRFDDPRVSRGPGGYKARRRNRYQPPTGTCKPKYGLRRDYDDDNGPPPPPRNGRSRCHSNVLINQNVRVNH